MNDFHLAQPKIPAPACSVHTWKTTCENLPPDTIERSYRFRDLGPYLAAIQTALPELRLSAAHLARFAACGTNTWIVWSPSRRSYSLRLQTCKLRWCPRCHQQSALRIRSRLQDALAAKTTTQWKLLTLTIRASKLPLEAQIKHLRTSFRRLRQRSFWRHKVHGGYSVLECTYNPKTHQWHPHLHCVIDSLWLPQRELSRQWLLASKDSMIVDIRPIRGENGAVNYLTKYLGKLPDLSLWHDHDTASEWIAAYSGTRLLSSFGNVPKLEEPEKPDPATNDWTPVMRLATLLNLVSRGDDRAISILRGLECSSDEIDAPEPSDST